MPDKHIVIIGAGLGGLTAAIKLQEAGTALDGVEAAEDGIEQVHVVGPIFQLDQLLGQLLQNLSGLDQKVLENFFIRFETHAPTPLGRVIGKRLGAIQACRLRAPLLLSAAIRQVPDLPAVSRATPEQDTATSAGVRSPDWTGGHQLRPDRKQRLLFYRHESADLHPWRRFFLSR